MLRDSSVFGEANDYVLDGWCQILKHGYLFNCTTHSSLDAQACKVFGTLRLAMNCVTIL